MRPVSWQSSPPWPPGGSSPSSAVTPCSGGGPASPEILYGAGSGSSCRWCRNRVHELNREHLAAPVAVMLSGLRLELWKRLRGTLGAWNPKPVYACVFGSAARGDGDSRGDIDLLLVHAPLPGESDPSRRAGGMDAVAGLAAEFMAAQLTERQAARWRRQVDQLRGLVRDWTGNPLQAVELSTFQWASHRRQASALFEEITRDAIEVAGGSR